MYGTTKTITLLALTLAAISSGGAFAIMQDDQPPQITDDGAKIFGHLEIVARDADGNIKAYRQTDNLVVTNGLEAAAERLFGANHATSRATIDVFDTIGVGTTGTGPGAGDEALVAQRAAKLEDGTVDPSGSNGAIIAVTFPASGVGSLQNVTGTAAIVESGLFDSTQNATSASNMFARQVFTAINVGESDTLTVTWTITFASV